MAALMVAAYFYFPLASSSLPFSSQSSVYVAVAAEEDGGEKIMLSGTLGGNSLKLKLGRPTHHPSLSKWPSDFLPHALALSPSVCLSHAYSETQAARFVLNEYCSVIDV